MKKKGPPILVWVLVSHDGIPQFAETSRKKAREARLTGERVYKYILG